MIKNKLSSMKGIRFITRFRVRGWMVTLFFFMAVFFVSIFVWWDCVLHDEPSTAVVEQFNANKEDFDMMRRKVESAIDQFKQKREVYEQAPNFDSQRELFRVPELPKPVKDDIVKADEGAPAIPPTKDQENPPTETNAQNQTEKPVIKPETTETPLPSEPKDASNDEEKTKEKDTSGKQVFPEQ